MESGDPGLLSGSRLTTSKNWCDPAFVLPSPTLPWKVEAGTQEIVVVDAMRACEPEAVEFLVRQACACAGPKIPAHFHGRLRMARRTVR
ncbi:MAG: hypothetical protein DMG51_17090 [Acidobacteria bacterium]|nr:MAG: hypothetical protein DMG51_17090 [Acidobacteriota bacterium]